MDIILIGLGVVGQGLVEILRDRADDLAQSYGFRARIVAVATHSRGSLAHPDGLDPSRLLQAAQSGHLSRYPDAPGLRRGLDALALIREVPADVMVEATPTRLPEGQPALEYCRAGLDAGKHIVLANKGPLAAAYGDLLRRAARAGRQVRFEGTVMAGTPALRLAQQALAGCRISEARGILNGTTNYILTRMEAGLDYAAALAEAQTLGYAEADPSADVDGWDAAVKLLILARTLFGAEPGLDDLDVTGIRDITPDAVAAARAAGERWKLIARITPEGGSVAPARVPLSDPLAAVAGATNAITYVTDLLGPVTLVGSGAGRLSTGFALLSDLLDLHRLA